MSCRSLQGSRLGFSGSYSGAGDTFVPRHGRPSEVSSNFDF